MGSVSQFCVQNLHCPTICVKQEQGFVHHAPNSPSESRLHSAPRICMAVDNTEHSYAMLQWAARHLIGDGDDIHLISVAHSHMPPCADLGLHRTAPLVLPCNASPEGSLSILLIREAHRAIQKAKEILEKEKANPKP